MNYCSSFICFLALLLAAGVSVSAQSQETASLVYGRPYRVPSVKVHLTDVETDGPFGERDILFRYCWGWDVLRETAETERMPRTVCKDTSGRTDKDGIAVLPTILITPSRPAAPAGAEFSQPRFKFAGIVVRDERHDAYISVFDAEVNLLDANGEVRRKVPLIPRPKTDR